MKFTCSRQFAWFIFSVLFTPVRFFPLPILDPVTGPFNGMIVPLTDEQVSFRLRVSKTDQRKKGCRVVLCKAPDPTFCPVLAMAVHLQVVPRDDSPLFRHVDGDPLTIIQFRAVFVRAGSS